MSIAIVWFRRDLRLTDHPALQAAVSAGHQIVPVYIHSPEEEQPWQPGGASRWWLHRSLATLSADLARLGSKLIIRQGSSLEQLRGIAQETGAREIHWNRHYEPALIARDIHVKSALREAGLLVESHRGNVMFEPWTVKSGAGTPFRVFTPFWKHCLTRLDEVPRPTPAPTALASPTTWPASDILDSLHLNPRVRWDHGFEDMWTPGEATALDRLESFLEQDAGQYGDQRNRPDLPATSRLGAALHFGEISARQVLTAGRSALARASTADTAGIDAFIRELGWREFAIHILYAFPHTPESPLDARFNHLAWAHDPNLLDAWRRGLTGIPLVDAGMRQLWHTGWMHNRVRMVVGSFLTKNLGQHWLEGARWFFDTLVDADLAANTLGWQWAAGCGADAAPYYRIFNPTLQSERFDPNRAYIRRWIPEISRLPDAWIHKPYDAPANVLAGSGVVLGRDYPRPVVDLQASRNRALAAYEPVKAAKNAEVAK
jgi:deoxyribodipyrimidine photo-lyase